MAKITYKDENGKVVEIPTDPDKSIHEMLEAASIDYPFSCLAGACSSCKIKIHRGKDKLELDKFGTPMIPVEDDEFLSCVCGITPEVLSDDSVVIELERSDDV
ncbi:MAG: 2Fe-2S iron-sulfur cluster binding domain-containing protein [bacterium]|nr:2Fe-2S iron-sulfur cluster binding domain-containing protein [bacterium]